MENVLGSTKLHKMAILLIVRMHHLGRTELLALFLRRKREQIKPIIFSTLHDIAVMCAVVFTVTTHPEDCLQQPVQHRQTE